ncbi:PREDICTED: glutathione S-transferase T3-like [Brassica oleracea var. oleracea]|uniref:glutathione S-transferase T3-like n=1 Tax=Brassica oleracea var. oleracea TaxID=109376 RepID=UPI0006A6AAD6|nr:PREDICTED: glutathione S-transferase T3-like [Brassica oleracea var. oleracea]
MVRRKWTPRDDEVVISAWLNTSKDPIVSNSMKLRTFWKRVDEFFAAMMNEKIENVHCKQRWNRINDQTNKFCVAFAAAERQATSGQCDRDMLKRAHEIFYSNQGQKFTLEHACSETPKRPEGIKAAKASRNNRKGKDIEDYKTIMEGKMEELDKKEKLSKLAILDTLLAKKDPLSESEETVKNKLLAQLF